MLLAVAPDGRRFGTPKRINPSSATIPDQVRLAVNPGGAMVVVWEDATAVRRRILLRASTDGGRTLGPVQVLSRAIKAYMPDVAVLPDGRLRRGLARGAVPLAQDGGAAGQGGPLTSAVTAGR